ncbi:GGDEF domain-containing protein [Marinobacter halodurans]|uniref:diguanylate cyclase n=1 Tax=Marinobacter halodurans TaxID=2528979 RepID=A0ABY1ZGK4_9GAMM|nr:diguanylate cyclase [Marinobacter halodurans]TBW51254.1 GGDEF domain-containing protein [Marinobacter halodurans]
MTAIEVYRLRRKPARVRIENYRKYVVLNITAIAGTLIHTGFIGLFTVIGADTLALFNILSVLVLAVSLWLNRAGMHAAAIYLMCLEIAGHAFLATATLGAAAGFHYYLWPVACVAVINPRMLPRQAAVIGFTLIALFAYLQLRYAALPYGFAYAEYLPLLLFFNVMAAALPLILAVVMVRQINESQERRLTEIANRDELTGLYNRRFGNDFLHQTFAASDRLARNYCIAMGDIDHFKAVNDRYGHEAGDQVLEDIAIALLGGFRRSDCLCRWGGEEFMIAFPDTTRETALAALERFRDRLASHYSRVDGERINVTMSFGLVSVRPGESVEAAIKRADHWLYEAKHQGRNRIVSDVHDTGADVLSHTG